ncbi:YafY family protein [Gorillibacterium sp. CAU 1737]|uniref:helix-turn-helix transcriptional regulator n=1 Tax=Gorillibacterium sp. CAU 1737 TaxID=3140362 RepID=UPI0032602DEE
MKVDRLISIIMLLLERKSIPAKALAERFEVSVRTIYRDMDAINLAGVPIVSTPGVNGGFSIMDEYKVDKKLFTEQDLATLLRGLGSLTSIQAHDEVAHTLAKIQSMLPSEQMNEIELKANQIAIDRKPWMGNRDIQKHLATIKEALGKRLLLSFHYSDRAGTASVRTIEPHQLVLKDNRWYVQGFCLEKQAFRLFKLTRMTLLKMEEESFVLREIPRPSHHTFTTQMAEKETLIQLLVHESALDQVREYCSSEHMEKRGEHEYLVRFPFIEDEGGYRLLFSFGDRCECVEPAHVREEMLRRIDNLASLYRPK